MNFFLFFTKKKRRSISRTQSAAIATGSTPTWTSLLIEFGVHVPLLFLLFWRAPDCWGYRVVPSVVSIGRNCLFPWRYRVWLGFELSANQSERPASCKVNATGQLALGASRRRVANQSEPAASYKFNAQSPAPVGQSKRATSVLRTQRNRTRPPRRQNSVKKPGKHDRPFVCWPDAGHWSAAGQRVGVGHSSMRRRRVRRRFWEDVVRYRVLHRSPPSVSTEFYRVYRVWVSFSSAAFSIFKVSVLPVFFYRVSTYVREWKIQSMALISM